MKATKPHVFHEEATIESFRHDPAYAAEYRNGAGSLSPVLAYVELGSNVGDGPVRLAAARQAVSALAGVRLIAASSLYRTEPQGLRDQPFFTNQVLELACAREAAPLSLLDMLLAVENSHGRLRQSGVRFGPRTLDLDLLLFGNEVMLSERLTLPHPRMLERAFVLLPLAELAPDRMLPQGLSVSAALGRLRYRQQGDIIYQDAT
jgi:2-amino-4-hydroxy-6-hydroxymethyldihydropteridine diphosphokinase